MAKKDQVKPSPKERTSMYLEPGMVYELKYVALMDDKTQTDIIQEALSEYLERWEKKRGPIPKKS